MKLFFRTLGEGQPLIIMHGLFGSSDNWLTIAKSFAQHFQVFLLDARNHGQSPWSDHHNYALMSQDLGEFIQEHNLKDPFIIGHSMGGKTLMKFITTAKISVPKFVVVDISPRFYEPHHDKEITALKSINLSTLQSRQEADDTMAKTIPEIGVRQFLLKNLYRKEDGSFHWRMNLDVLTSQIQAVGEGTSETAKSEIPALFIKGAKSEYYIQEADKELIKKIFPNSQVIEIQGSGHWVQAEQPQAFYDAVMNFLTH
jgi:esterase